MTGASELSQYGNWATTTDYGSVWYPSHVYVGWAPYTYGYWNWVGPWGWTWIDYAPWGFAPFHYGRWVWIGGRWGWCPGHWGPRPIYAPGLVGWVGGAGFVSAGRPMVGWVPLAPNEPYYPGYAVSGHYWNIVNGRPPSVHLPTNPITARPRVVRPGESVAYANRGVQGAVSFAPTQSLSSRQPITAHRPPAQAKLLESVLAGKAQTQAPPAPPPGRSYTPRVVATPSALGSVRAGASNGRPVQAAQPGAAARGGQAGDAVRAGPAAPGRTTAPAAPAAPARGGPARGGMHSAALPVAGTAPPTAGHLPAPSGGPQVVFSAPTAVPQPVPLVTTNAPVPLVNPNAPVPLVNRNAPVPLVNPNAPVPLVNPNAPVPLVTPPQTRPGTPILVRVPIRGGATAPDPGSDDGGTATNGRQGSAPGVAVPQGAGGFMGAGRVGGGIGGVGGGMGGGPRGGGR
jgi:hypothetical protein